LKLPNECVLTDCMRPDGTEAHERVWRASVAAVRATAQLWPNALMICGVSARVCVATLSACPQDDPSDDTVSLRVRACEEM
jgi:hypothetical protein